MNFHSKFNQNFVKIESLQSKFIKDIIVKISQLACGSMYLSPTILCRFSEGTIELWTNPCRKSLRWGMKCCNVPRSCVSTTVSRLNRDKTQKMRFEGNWCHILNQPIIKIDKYFLFKTKNTTLRNTFSIIWNSSTLNWFKLIINHNPSSSVNGEYA